MTSESTSKPNETARAGDPSNLAHILAFAGSQFENTSTAGMGEADPEFDADSEVRQGIPGIPGEDFLRDSTYQHLQNCPCRIHGPGGANIQSTVLGSSLANGQKGSKPATSSPENAGYESQRQGPERPAVAQGAPTARPPTTSVLDDNLEQREQSGVH